MKSCPCVSETCFWAGAGQLSTELVTKYNSSVSTSDESAKVFAIVIGHVNQVEYLKVLGFLNKLELKSQNSSLILLKILGARLMPSF